MVEYWEKVSLNEPIPLLDLTRQTAPIREELIEAILPLVDSQRFILGPAVEQLEREIAAYCQTRFAVGCASGSDALLLALLALGVGPGDEVVTVPYTFFATAGAIALAGARPVFVDIEPDTLNLDASRLEEALDRHPRTRAIVPVHLFGACADMDAILAIAEARGIPVIEDAAQAIGAEYRHRRAGSLGRVACFSFFPSKNLGAWGDAGMLTTSDEGLADRLRALRVHGSRERYHHEWTGMNSRLDTLQAAVLAVKLKYLDRWTAGRQRNAAFYRRRFAELGTPVEVPVEAVHTTRHIYNQFVIRSERRDALRNYLAAAGIGTEIYYPLPLHLQPCFAGLGYGKGDFPAAEAAAARSLALPVYAELTEDELARICQTVHAFWYHQP